jgi:DNA mismatch repair protein MutL
MPRIRILPDILANKIAAGEVVERPAAVVKELVENALDAQSSRIAIEIENGGRSLIQVADNGTGMGHDDALLALERFATSKLRTDADLGAIRTLGFRGEALPSIAAVSKLSLVTREQGAGSGVQIQVEAGKIVRVTETGAPPGTLVRVTRLFYNIPARRKFLKTINTEMGHIADTVNGMALGWPRVHFTLTHNARTVKQWPRAADGAERAADVLGQADRGGLVPIDARSGPARLCGWAAPAHIARNTSRGAFFFVNGRRVRDRVIQHGLFEGFHGRLMKGRFPLAVLFLTLPYDQVDVNVHPTKHEVRFADPQRVHDLVRDSVMQALAGAERRMWGRGRDDAMAPVNKAGVAEPAAGYAPRPPPPAGARPARVAENRPAHPPPAQKTLWQAGRFAGLTVIGQFRGTYIICQDGDDLILIDQHAAHERIVFEALGGRGGRPESQRLLLPETLELGFAEARVLEQLVDELAALGLEIEPFGGTTFAVKAVPALLGGTDAAGLVRGLAEHCAEIGLNAGLDKIMTSCRMVMACHTAVRANQRLADAEVRRLLEALDRCENPSHCPHGRPTWIRWTLGDLEKRFGRTT